MKLKVTVIEPESRYGYKTTDQRTHVMRTTRPVIVTWEPGFPGTDVTGAEPDEVWIEEEGNPHNKIYLETPSWYYKQKVQVRIEQESEDA